MHIEMAKIINGDQAHLVGAHQRIAQTPIPEYA
jgi:hypothetical protein